MISRPKYVLISGASTGIGKTCALHLDRLGFHVFAGVRKPEDGENLRQEASSRLEPVLLDVTDQDSILASHAKISGICAGNGLAGLVNNAGIATPGPVAFLPLDYWRQIFEINVFGHIVITQTFFPLLKLGGGRIINMSSISGRIAYPLMGPYAASKFALEAISDALRLEMLPFGVKVCVIEPGPIRTPIWEKGFEIQRQIKSFLPDWAYKDYRHTIDGILEHARRSAENAPPPEIVANAVEHALTAKNPKTRYPIGSGVKFYTRFFRVIPDKIRDKLIAKAAGLKENEAISRLKG